MGEGPLADLAAFASGLRRPRHWFARFCVLAAVLALGLPIAAHDLILTILIGAGLVSLTLFVGRHARHRNRTDSIWSGLRFSTADLLLGVITIAVVLTMTVRIRHPTWKHGFDIVVAGAAFAGITLMSWWAVTGSGRSWWRLAAAAIACPAVGVLLVRSSLIHAEEWPGELLFLRYSDYLKAEAPWCCLTAATMCTLLVLALVFAGRASSPLK